MSKDKDEFVFTGDYAALLTDEELALAGAELSRRERARRRYACQSCGAVMSLDYIEGEFNERGCIECGHPTALELREVKTHE